MGPGWLFVKDRADQLVVVAAATRRRHRRRRHRRLPWWHNTLDGLRKNAEQLATTYGKEVLVVEAGFSWNEGTADRMLLWHANFFFLIFEDHSSEFNNINNILYDNMS